MLSPFPEGWTSEFASFIKSYGVMEDFMRSLLRLATLIVLFISPALAQQPTTVKARVHVTDRDTWQEQGGFAARNGVAAGSYEAGVVRQNTELVKTLNRQCPDVTITANKAAADYIVIWDHTDWAHTKWSGSQNQFTVYKANGDLVGSGSAHKMPNAAKGICELVTKGSRSPSR